MCVCVWTLEREKERESFCVQYPILVPGATWCFGALLNFAKGLLHELEQRFHRSICGPHSGLGVALAQLLRSNAPAVQSIE